MLFRRNTTLLQRLSYFTIIFRKTSEDKIYDEIAQAYINPLFGIDPSTSDETYKVQDSEEKS